MAKLSINFGSNEVNYSILNHKDVVMSKADIDQRISQASGAFSELNRASGNPIHQGSEVQGIVGPGLFNWMRSWRANPAQMKEQYTSRVIALIKDLQRTSGFGLDKVVIAGVNMEHLNTQMFIDAQIPVTLKLGPAAPVRVVGAHGGIFNPDYLDALNANQPTKLSQADINRKGDIKEWNKVRDNYNAFIGRVRSPSGPSEPQIPKKIHLIWLGTEPNEEVLRVRDSWSNHHAAESGWDVKLWTNDDVAEIVARKRLQYPKVGQAWDAATKFAEKADIARLCILEEEGGLYADTDLPCYGKVDDLHYNSDFYAALEQNDHGAGILYVGNALFAARPGHPLIIGCLNNLKPRQAGEGDWAIIGRTGPGLLTDQVYEGLRQDLSSRTNKTLILPPAYFYPLHSGERVVAASTNGYAEAKVLDYSKGLHLWNFTWKGEVDRLIG